MFEVWAEGIGAQNAVCGGGRYDVLAEVLGGAHVPGVGFGSGLERVILTMKAQQVLVPSLPQPQVMVLYLGKEAQKAASQLANELRVAGIRTKTSFGHRSMRAQFRQANRSRAVYTCILGEDELRSEQVAVRDMTAGGQQLVMREAVVMWLQARLETA